jgi:type VI secretion system secreted protein Hcp
MPTVAYMSAEGATQGNITAGANSADSMGNKYQQDHTDETTVLEFKHEIVVPRDVQSGQPTGQRMHQPAVIRTRYDKSTPLFYNALCSGERLTKVVIKWYRTSMEGTMEHYFTHELEDALLVNMEAEMPHTADPALAHFDHEIVMQATYRKIIWTHEIAGTSGEDDWRAPKV